MYILNFAIIFIAHTLTCGDIYVSSSEQINTYRKNCHLMNLHTALHCKNVSIEDILSFLTSDINYLRIEHILQNQLSLPLKEHLPNLETLILFHGQLEIISVGSISGMTNLKELILNRNRLSYFNKDVFNDVPNLKIINLSENKFSSLTNVFPAIRQITNLTELNLSKNILLTSITSDEIEQLKNVNINQLILADCSIIRLDITALIVLNDIRYIDLSHNPLGYDGLKNLSLGLSNSALQYLKIQSLSPEAFGSKVDMLNPFANSSLEGLDISQNNLMTAPDFRSFQSLRELRMFSCNLTAVDGYKIFNIPNLNLLDISENKIITISANLVNVNNNLKTLNLSKNRRSFGFLIINSKLFELLYNLQILDMSVTAIEHITKSTFPGLRNLLKLTINYCFIKSIEDGAFHSLSSLESLALEGNHLTIIKADTFFGLTNLVQLSLEKNQISFLNGSTPFIYLTKLQILNIANNRITHLESSFFKHLPRLEVLQLWKNYIKPWDTRVFTEHRYIYYISLRHNKINRITSAMLEDFKSESLQTLSLAYNDFDCFDCGLFTFREWYMKSNLTLELLVYPDTYVCKSPQKIRNDPILRADLSDSECLPIIENKMIIYISSSLICIFVITIGISAFIFRWHFRYWWYLFKSKVKKYKEYQDSISYQYDAFVSFDSEDTKWILEELLPTLETEETSMKFCLIERDCPAGNDIMEMIIECIHKCRKTVLVLSESYIKNHWCMFELQMAEHSLFDERRDSLIMIQLEPLQEELSSNLNYLITTRTYIQWVDHPMGQKLFWKRLRSALAKPDILQMSRIV